MLSADTIDRTYEISIRYGVSRLLAKWEPYAGLIYFHMLLYHLNETDI